MGTQIVGRDDPDLENMIGIFLNNLVMRFDASGDPAFDEFLTRVNGTVQDALIHQRMPFHKLVEVLNPPRDSQRPPLISLNFTVLRDVMDHKTYRSFDLHGQPSLSAGSLYDLFFSWCIGRMAGAWPWNSTLTCSNGALPSGCSNS
ncbi:MAG: condensation domain-containing protein [Methylocella sp.]